MKLQDTTYRVSLVELPMKEEGINDIYPIADDIPSLEEAQQIFDESDSGMNQELHLIELTSDGTATILQKK